MKKNRIKPANEIIYEKTYKNGFRLFVWPYKHSEDISMSLTVKYGSICTTFKTDKDIKVENGIAHFIEHVKFNESSSKSAHEEFGKLGSYVNAYTTYDHTSYEVICTNDINKNLSHLLFFVFNDYFTNEKVEKEKPIIIEESKMTMDNPYNEGYRKLLENLYINDRRKYLITGTPEEIQKIDLKSIKEVFDNFYTPDNMFLSVCGNVDYKEIESIVDNFFKKNNIKRKKALLTFQKESDDVLKEEETLFNGITNQALLLNYKIPLKSLKKYDKLKLKFLIYIILNMNFGATSLFKEKLINDELIKDLYYSVTLLDDHIIIAFEVSSDYPKKVSLLLNDKMNNLEYSKEDLKRKVKCYIAQTILAYDAPDDVNSKIVNDIINYDKIINNEAEMLKKISTKDLKNIIKNINARKRVEVIIKPKKETK